MEYVSRLPITQRPTYTVKYNNPNNYFMKKLLYGIAALAIAFLAGSCQRENLEPVAEGTTVTYTVQVPGALTTKAGETYGGAVNQLVYEVHRVLADETTQLLYQKTETITNGVVNLDIEFVKDQNFKVLFWAQKENVYNKDGAINLTAVEVPARQAAGAEENYEAFYGTDDFTNGTSAASGKVTLTRAVSLLSIGTTQASLNVGDVDGNVGLNGASVTVKDLPNTLNVMTGEATANADQTYPSATGSTFVVGTETYVYVAKNYVAFADAEKSTVDVELTITTDEGTINHSIPSVPLKRNFKTNIVGDLITASAKYNITLSDDWSDETLDIILVNDALSLQEAINQSPDNQETEIKLEGDIDLNDLAALLGTLSTKAGSDPVYITVPAGKIVTLDLNGYTLSGVDETQTSYGLITNKGNLTIVNSAEDKAGKIMLKATVESEWNRYSSVISTQPGSTLTVGAGVEIEHLGGTSMSYAIDVLTNGRGTSAVAVIDGATVKSTYRAIRQFLNGTEAVNSLTVKAGSVIKSTNGNKSIWMQDPSANANTGSLVVEEGAELYGNVFLSVTAGSTEWPVSVSVAASALKGESVVETNSNVPAGYSLENKDGVYTVEFHPVAMIGEKGYATLIDAVAAVQDGGTITLVANETFTENNRYDNGGWWDGLGYSGDKSFTIDLGGYTIKQDGSLNDYLIWIKNDGAKANTITLKNGTMDAGTTAFCAIATSSSNKQTITINLENINLINNISNGAVAKIRGGSVLNVKPGTVITGKNSYTGIEAVGNNTVVNIYEGAEIYQNGTSSDVGAIVGASYNATLNIYGGKGKSAKCGIIVMSTGATINVYGGEWTANGDGTVSNDNAGVLVSQNNRYESGWACKSILNVTGGTFKGGYNCYGMGPGVEADDAQINIKGGNFNADPKSYVVNGYKAVESNGVYNVVVDPVAKIGETEYATLQEAFNAGGEITLLRDVTISETATLAEGQTVVLDLNGKTLAAADMNVVKNNGGNLTIKNGTVTRTGDVVGYSVNNASGEIAVVNATIQRGLYTSGSKMTATNANISHEQSSRHAIYAWDCEVTINSGTFHNGNAGNATLMASGSSVVTINGGTFNIADGRSTLGWTSSMIDQNSTAQVVVKGGLFNGGFRINSADTKLTIEGGEFNTNNGSAFTDYSGTKVVKGGKFTDAGAQNWAKKYIAEGYEMNANGEVVAK